MKERRTGKKKVYSPIICTTTEEKEDKYLINVIMPGVKKSDYSLRLNESKLFVEGESRQCKYLGDIDFCCLINPEKASFTFEDGNLQIHAPFKEMSIDYSKIEIH